MREVSDIKSYLTAAFQRTAKADSAQTETQGYGYRGAVMKAYLHGHFPVFQNFNHMQYQIKDPKGFAEMLDTIVEKNALPELPFLSE